MKPSKEVTASIDKCYKKRGTFLVQVDQISRQIKFHEGKVHYFVQLKEKQQILDRKSTKFRTKVQCQYYEHQ